MGERGRELYGLAMSPDNSLLVACGDAVVVATVRNAMAADDVATSIDVMAADGVVVAVGVATVVVVWVQQC